MNNPAAKLDPVRQRLVDLVSENELDLAKASRAIGRNHAYLHQFVHYSKPKRLDEEDRLKLAQLLGCDESELRPAGTGRQAVTLPSREHPLPGLAEDVPPNAVPAPDVPIHAAGPMPLDVPVMGTAVGGHNGDFQLNGQIVDHIRRPPALIGRSGVFAVYAQGDSMYPWRNRGDAVYVDATRPARPGDFVMVECHGSDGEPGPAYLKLLVSETATKIRLKQFNPLDDRIEIPRTRVRHVYRVIDWPELLGI